MGNTQANQREVSQPIDEIGNKPKRAPGEKYRFDDLSDEQNKLLNKHMDKFSSKFQEYLDKHDKRVVKINSDQ